MMKRKSASRRGGAGLANLVERRRGDILHLADRHGVRNVRIFGSLAQGKARPGSDLDLLVQMEEGRTLLDLIAFWQDVQELLGRKVDVISEGGLSPHLHDQILAEAIPL